MILRRNALLRPERHRIATVLLLAVALLLTLPGRFYAHEIPASVMVRVFIMPDHDTLRVVMRVPVEAMRDVELPLRGPGYVDIARAEPLLRDASMIWLADYLQLYEGSRQLTGARISAARLSLPSDRSFATYDAARAHVNSAPLPPETDVAWRQALFDVELSYRIESDSSRFSVHPALAHLGIRTTTVLRFLPPGGAERAFEYEGDPGLVRLDPRWHQAALTFVRAGFFHILGGIDHLLFLFCLVIPFRRVRPLVAIVTAFTVAHSITLIASAMGIAPGASWFPPLIETLIALSVVYMALENIVATPTVQRRWIMAFAFGLVHGFGFSFALRETLQFAGAHLATSLVAFNVGVELGQVAVLLLTVPALAFAFHHAARPRALAIVLSALVAHTAWHWMLERGASLMQYRVTLPDMSAALAASAVRAAMLILVIGATAWALSGLMSRLARAGSVGEVGADQG